jgi:hypothetical protein
VEFYDYLRSGKAELRGIVDRLEHKLGPSIHVDRDDLELTYSVESIFSGIDSFARVTRAYKVGVGALNSEVRWGSFAAQALKDEFDVLFQRFEVENTFEKKCRLLLDLFKIQIVFAGMIYD